MFRRFWTWFKGFLGVKQNQLEAATPEATLEGYKLEFERATADYQTSMGLQGKLIKSLEAQIEQGGIKAQQIEARLQTLMGLTPEQDPTAEGKCLDLAGELEEVNGQVKTNRGQLKVAQDGFDEMVKQRKAFVADGEEKIRKVKGMIGTTKMKEAQASLTKMVSPVSSPSTSGLDHLAEALQERQAAADGDTMAAQAAANSSAWSVSEAEKDVLKKAALARYKASKAPAAAPEAAKAPTA